MGKIFCLMGKSASGKDTIYRHLLADGTLDLQPVVLYTTRPIRAGEEDGVTYHFCSTEEAQAMQAAGRVVEMRTYQTVYGPWSYFTADDGQIDPDGNSSYLVIGTLESYEKLCRYFGKEFVAGIYIWTDDGLRLQRALDREREQKQPKYAEMCRRFLADEKDFSEENLRKAGVTHRFENRDLGQVTEEISDFIRWKERNGRISRYHRT